MGKNDIDVIDFLIDQHREIRTMFDEVANASGGMKEEAFRRLVRLLAVHETAEEELVHPYARKTIENGDQVIDARLREENEAKQMLVRLDEMGVDHPDFHKYFQELREDVLAHADAEELHEFSKLREETSAAKLRAMSAGVKAAQAMAPTRPHPGVESMAKNLLLGPPAAIMDRVKDAIRAAMAKG